MPVPTREVEAVPVPTPEVEAVPVPTPEVAVAVPTREVAVAVPTPGVEAHRVLDPAGAVRAGRVDPAAEVGAADRRARLARPPRSESSPNRLPRPRRRASA